MSLPSRKKIALLIETSLGSGREILRGVARYARQTGSWQINHAAGGFGNLVPNWLESWDGDGVIARIQNEETLAELEKLNLPVIDVLGNCKNRFPLVHVDDTAIAKQALEHFSERLFRNYAFYGISGELWSKRRGDAFESFCTDAASFSRLEVLRRHENPDEALASLQKWISNLPKPCGVLVSSDQRGMQFLEACRLERIPVPEQLAVVGVDNDITLCEISDPPLSSIRGGHFAVGYDSARLMDHLLAGGAAPLEPIVSQPNGVVERESSKTRAIPDPLVARGVRHIREHLAEAITNDTIAKSLGVSRTLFQKRFRAAMDQSIREFILENRIERARILIDTSQITFAEIAEYTGFRHQEYLGQIIKKNTGMTPGQLRKSSREPS